MIRIYRQPKYDYWVCAIGRLSLRMDWRADRKWKLTAMSSSRLDWTWDKRHVWFVALWAAGAFFQLDWNLNEGGTL